VRDVVALYAGGPQVVGLDMASDEPAFDSPVADLALQRLLANLIDNAFAYGRAPVTVQVRADSVRHCIDIAVLDHGEGMSAADFHRARQPFVRLTGARSELGHCGLGLAIVAQMARQLGGGLRTLRADDGRFGIVLELPA
jgi:two-component system, OmpR family, osmolarity sensor histidine kinase EnvZ